MSLMYVVQSKVHEMYTLLPALSTTLLPSQRMTSLEKSNFAFSIHDQVVKEPIPIPEISDKMTAASLCVNLNTTHTQQSHFY